MQVNTRKTVLISFGLFLAALLGVWWYFGFSLEFMKFFAAEPESIVTTTPTPAVGNIIQCLPDTQTVSVGQPAILTPSVVGSHNWYAPGGVPATGQGDSFSVTYADAGYKQVTLESRRSDGSGQVDSVACTVAVTP